MAVLLLFCFVVRSVDLVHVMLSQRSMLLVNLNLTAD